MVTTIVFDLGGVLLDWNPRYLYQKLFPDQEELDYFLAEICSPAWNAQMDAGKPFQEAIAELCLVHPQYTEQIRAYDSRWEEMMGEVIPGTVDLLQVLNDQGRPLAALSNWSLETFPRIRKNYGFLEWFDPLILSGGVGVAKPAPAIFQYLLQELGGPAQECLFIDDSLENVQEAKRQGFATIHFQSSDRLREDLTGMGLL